MTDVARPPTRKGEKAHFFGAYGFLLPPRIESLIGTVAPVEITATGAWSLHGILVGSSLREAVA